MQLTNPTLLPLNLMRRHLHSIPLSMQFPFKSFNLFMTLFEPHLRLPLLRLERLYQRPVLIV
jgi:hypothetical protein